MNKLIDDKNIIMGFIRQNAYLQLHYRVLVIQSQVSRGNLLTELDFSAPLNHIEVHLFCIFILTFV